MVFRHPGSLKLSDPSSLTVGFLPYIHVMVKMASGASDNHSYSRKEEGEKGEGQKGPSS